MRAVSSLQTSPHPSHLTRPHPHAVRCKVIIISDCRLVPYWRNLLASVGLEFGQTFLLQTHRLARKHLTDWATKTDYNCIEYISVYLLNSWCLVIKKSDWLTIHQHPKVAKKIIYSHMSSWSHFSNFQPLKRICKNLGVNFDDKRGIDSRVKVIKITCVQKLAHNRELWNLDWK